MDEMALDKECISEHLVRQGRVLRLQSEWQVFRAHLD